LAQAISAEVFILFFPFQNNSNRVSGALACGEFSAVRVSVNAMSYLALSGRTAKVAFGEDTRRAQILIPDGASQEEAFQVIQEMVRSTFNLQEASSGRMTIKYADEEGDMCTLTAHTVNDLASVFPQGVVRLALALPPMAAPPQTPAQVTPEASGPPPDLAASAPQGASAQEGARLGLEGVDPALQELLRGINPETLHHLAGQFFGGKGGGKGIDGILGQIDPNTLHSLLSTMVAGGQGQGQGGQRQDAPNPSSETQPPPATPAPRDAQMPRANMDNKGMAAGGQGATGAGQAIPPNPLQGLLGALLAPPGHPQGGPAQATPCTAGAGHQPPPNPLQGLFGALLQPQGGNTKANVGTAEAGQPPPNLLQGLVGALLAPPPQGQSQGQPPPNPLQGLLGAVLAGQPQPAQPGAPPATTPTPASGGASGGAGSGGAGDPERAAFEQSAADLVEMGLVPNLVEARQLLTQYGDISTVVSILSEGE